MKTATLLAGLALATTGCNLDQNLGATHHDQPPDAAFDAELPAVAMPILHSHASTLLIEGDDLIFDGSDPLGHPGLARRSPDGTVDIMVPGHMAFIAADAVAYYAAAFELGGSSTVVSIDRTSHAVTDLIAPGVGPTAGGAIAIDDDWIYLDRGGPLVNGVPTGQVLRVAKNGSRVDVLLGGLDSPLGLAVDAAFVYVAEDLGGTVRAIRKSDGAAFTLADGLSRPTGLLVVGEWLYLSEDDDRNNGLTDGRISRIRRPDASATPASLTPEVLVTGLALPRWMAVADGTLYWTAYFGGLQRAPLDGGAAETIIGCHGSHEPPGPPSWPQGCGAIAIHGANVYFAARDPQNLEAIYEIPR